MLRNFNKLIINNKNVFGVLIRNNSTKLTLTTEENGIRNIILNNPKSRNALSLEMLDEISENVAKNQDDVNLRAIVLSSSGPSVFSGGHNLKELTVDKGEDYLNLVFQRCSKLMLDFSKCPVPIIAKVDGIAAAAGCQLVSSCDIVLCSDISTFSTPGANVGVFCSTPGIAVARTMPRMKASFMLLTGLPITAQEAYVAGLVNKVVPSADLDKELTIICDSIKMKSRSVIAMGKKFFYKQINMDIDKAYEMGSKTMVSNLGMKDGIEGVHSFIEKRKPVWSHDKK